MNVKNKLGYEGRLANAFANLVSGLWLTEKKTTFSSGSSSSISPKKFRKELAALKEQFAGNEQHVEPNSYQIIVGG